MKFFLQHLFNANVYTILFLKLIELLSNSIIPCFLSFFVYYCGLNAYILSYCLPWEETDDLHLCRNFQSLIARDRNCFDWCIPKAFGRLV